MFLWHVCKTTPPHTEHKHAYAGNRQLTSVRIAQAHPNNQFMGRLICNIYVSYISCVDHGRPLHGRAGAMITSVWTSTACDHWSFHAKIKTCVHYYIIYLHDLFKLAMLNLYWLCALCIDSLCVCFDFWLYRLKFPSVLVVNTTLTVVFLDIVLLIGYTDRPYFFCNSQNELTRQRTPTPFCSITGWLFDNVHTLSLEY